MKLLVLVDHGQQRTFLNQIDLVDDQKGNAGFP